MPHTKITPVANRLLAALPNKDYQQFLSGCECVDLEFAQILTEPGERIQHVYFPKTCSITLVTKMDSRTSLEVGLVGSEGMFGISATLGVNESPFHAVVQGNGATLRMKIALFRRELAKSPALQVTLRQYLFVMMGQLAQNSACCRFHVVEARLARWLLMTQDRAHSNNFHVTQEFLASLLGVRRVGVTNAATALHKRKLISYTRGDITILDRRGLEAASCVCYAIDQAAYSTVMGKSAG